MTSSRQAISASRPGERAALPGSASLCGFFIAGIPQSLEQGRGDVDAGDSRECPPAWNRVDLKDHKTSPVKILDQVDSGDLGSECVGGRQGESLGLRFQGTGFGSSAQRDVGSPFVGGRIPAHGTENPPLKHEHPEIVTGMADHSLKVENGFQTLESMEGPPGEFPVAHPDEPTSFRAEERFDDHIAAQALERRQRLGGRLSGPGWGNRKAGVFEKSQAEELVDGSLDGPGRVPDRNAGRVDAMTGRPSGKRPVPDFPEASSAPGRRRSRSGRHHRIRFSASGSQSRLRHPGKGSGLELDREQTRGSMEVGDMPASA